jgi:hypothetical protein
LLLENIFFIGAPVYLFYHRNLSKNYFWAIGGGYFFWKIFLLGCWMLDAGCWMLDAGLPLGDARCSMFDVGGLREMGWFGSFWGWAGENRF